ncbi:MAG: crossover junction endodeoxyribonuclease RuvC [Fimbriimonadaceae bacterium]
MIVLAFDPGLERLGFGCIRMEGSRIQPVDFGLIQTPRIELGLRLRQLHDQAGALMDRVQPDAVATERLLFAANKTTALDVAKAIGVVLLAAGQRGLPVTEYTPPQIKQAVVGVGNADKRQVQYMVTRLLGLAAPPKPDDVADALGVALCHALKARTPGLGTP